jgi:hypothetical protein
VMNMIVSLRASLAESSSMPANNNTRLAIAIFSQFQQERHMF